MIHKLLDNSSVQLTKESFKDTDKDLTTQAQYLRNYKKSPTLGSPRPEGVTDGIKHLKNSFGGNLKMRRNTEHANYLTN